MTQQLVCGDESGYDGDDIKAQNESSSGRVMIEMFLDQNIRVLVVSTLVLQAAQQLCG